MRRVPYMRSISPHRRIDTTSTWQAAQLKRESVLLISEIGATQQELSSLLAADGADAGGRVEKRVDPLGVLEAVADLDGQDFAIQEAVASH